jgi:hypothetical protein
MSNSRPKSSNGIYRGSGVGLTSVSEIERINDMNNAPDLLM